MNRYDDKDKGVFYYRLFRDCSGASGLAIPMVLAAYTPYRPEHRNTRCRLSWLFGHPLATYELDSRYSA